MRKLREIRTLRGITLDDVWIGTGIYQSHLSRLERGLIEAKPRERALLCRFFGLTEKELFPEYKEIGPEFDRDLYRQLKKKISIDDRIYLFAKGTDYNSYRERLLNLCEKYDVPIK